MPLTYTQFLEAFRRYVDGLPPSDRNIPLIPIQASGVVLTPAQALRELEANTGLGQAVFAMHVAGIRQLSLPGALEAATAAFLQNLPPNIHIAQISGLAPSRNVTGSQAAQLVAAGQLPALEAALRGKLLSLEKGLP